MSDGVNFSQSLKFFQSGAVENKPIPQSHPLTSQDVIPNIVKNTVAAFDNSMGLHAEHAEVRGRAQSITAEHSPATQHADQVAEATIKPTTQNKLQEKLEKRRGSVVSRNNEMKAERKETLLGRSSKSMQNQINDARRGIKLGASRLTPGSSIHTFVSNDLPVNTGARRDSIETQNPSRHEIMEMRLEEQEPQTTFVDFPNKGEESPLDGSSVYATTSLPHENTQEKTIPFTKYITNIKKGKLNSSQQKKLINLTTNSLRNDMLNSLKQINPQFMHTKNETSSIHISNAIQAQNTVINVVTNSLFDVSNQKEFERQYNFFVEVGHSALESGDFQTAMAISMALARQPLDRLVKDKSVKAQRLAELSMPNRDFENLKKEVTAAKNQNMAIVPPLNLMIQQYTLASNIKKENEKGEYVADHESQNPIKEKISAEFFEAVQKNKKQDVNRLDVMKDPNLSKETDEEILWNKSYEIKPVAQRKVT